MCMLLRTSFCKTSFSQSHKGTSPHFTKGRAEAARDEVTCSGQPGWSMAGLGHTCPLQSITSERKSCVLTHPSHNSEGGPRGLASFPGIPAIPLASPCQWVFKLSPERHWPLGGLKHEPGS